MQVEECYLKGTCSARLFGKLWRPDESMHALIVMVHGIGEHSGCYERWAEKFVAGSIGFFAFDMRGHGRSSGIRGHASGKMIMGDLNLVLKTVKCQFPDLPIVLYGHSLGGNIVLSYAINAGVCVQGIIASSPWLRLVNSPSPGVIKLAKLASSIVPFATVKIGVKADDLSRGIVVKSTKTDPLMHKKISIKLFTDICQNSAAIMRSKHRLNVPLLLMHGTSDKLTASQASKSFAQNAGTFTKYKEWKGMYHDLHNETNSEAIYQYVLNWISKRIVANPNEALQNSRKIFRVA